MKTRIILILFVGLYCTVGLAQQATVKNAFLEKWKNSENYLVEIVNNMPFEKFSYKPTPRQMSFLEQVQHIQQNMNWLSSTYFNGKPSEKITSNQSKNEIVQSLKHSFQAVYSSIQNTTENDLKETVSFFAGPKSKLQILNLLQDHVSHHRGQLIVYLNLNNIEPPRYVGW